MTSRSGTAVVAVLALFTVLGVSGCASGSDKYKQTWAKSYGSTSCEEWSDSMSSQQRFAAAADMLVALRSDSGMPSDDMVHDFESGMDRACGAARHSDIGTVGGLLFSTNEGEFNS